MRHNQDAAVAAATVADDARSALLADLLGRVARVLSPAGDPAVLRPDSARAADGTDDRNCQPVAEAIGHRGPHRLQQLLSRAVWDDQQVLDIAAA